MSHFVTTSRLSWSGSFQKRLSIYRSRKISSCFNGTHQNYNVNNKRILKTKSKMRWVKKKLSEQLHRVTCQSLWKSISLQCQNVFNEWFHFVWTENLFWNAFDSNFLICWLAHIKWLPCTWNPLRIQEKKRKICRQ